MTTITEDYVSFETAKLLKEKWFDGECNSYYDEFGLVCPTIEPKFANLEHYKRYSLNVAMKWLREVHNIHIIAEPCLGEGFDNTLCFNRWFWTILKEEGEYEPIRKIDEFPTYEKACEEAIKYCLENLI